ncbi:MAG: cyclic nucleotide-binding domain-containing protein [Actinomycetota bacterium]
MGLFGIGNKIDLELLRYTPLFSGFSDSELNDVAKLAEKVEFGVGDTIIEQGRYGDACFVISEGTGAVYINDVFVTTVREHTAIGEMAILERRPRNATVIAETPMVVAKFGVDDFRKVLSKYPTTELRVQELLTNRLRDNTARDE